MAKKIGMKGKENVDGKDCDCEYNESYISVSISHFSCKSKGEMNMAQIRRFFPDAIVDRHENRILIEVDERVERKYISRSYIKQLDVVKAMPVPPDFQKVACLMDPEMRGRYVLQTRNRTSNIIHAITSVIYYSTDRTSESQTKLMLLKQIERESDAAKLSGDAKEIEKWMQIINRVVNNYEPWLDNEWILASKAFFAPIHIHSRCGRVFAQPHVKRYAFSPEVINEIPIRLVIDQGEYEIKK